MCHAEVIRILLRPFIQISCQIPVLQLLWYVSSYFGGRQGNTIAVAIFCSIFYNVIRYIRTGGIGMLRATEDGFMAGGFVQATHAPEVKYAQDSMELLYLWIGKDDTCFIQQQGFNFSPNYQFNITDMGVDGYQLDWSEKQEHFNVWDYQNIVNLTAIVGENGTGKTTLLRYLTAAPQMLNKKNSDDQLVQIYR